MSSPSDLQFVSAIGTPVTLQMLTGGRHRFTATIFGVLDQASVLVHLAAATLARVQLREEDGLVARCLIGRQVYGFKSSVLRICFQPYPYLHLAYPHDVECVELRKSERVVVSLPVQVIAKQGSYNAHLIDLSASGAQVTCDQVLGEVGDELKLAFTLTFAGVSRELMCAGLVRNISKGLSVDSAQHTHGVEFLSLSQEDIQFLLGYLYETLAHGRRAPSV
ncbi:MAG: flagellar brake protein [Burkholderiales bacterium]|nr:flagellar brake protein [Burkholderiales bacterium]